MIRNGVGELGVIPAKLANQALIVFLDIGHLHKEVRNPSGKAKSDGSTPKRQKSEIKAKISANDPSSACH